jgi:hypothetical protein
LMIDDPPIRLAQGRFARVMIGERAGIASTVGAL